MVGVGIVANAFATLICGFGFSFELLVDGCRSETTDGVDSGRSRVRALASCVEADAGLKPKGSRGAEPYDRACESAYRHLLAEGRSTQECYRHCAEAIQADCESG